MLLLTINAGSSSLRMDLFEQIDNSLIRLGGVYHEGVNKHKQSLLDDFIASADAEKIKLIVHRVVHGGALLTTPCLIDDSVEAEIERLIPLAPLHNPAALAWIRLIRRVLGEQVPQVSVFDTAFYRSLPHVAATYALPHELCRRHGIRRYGFHGIAHRAMWQRWRELRPGLKLGGRVISIQLGAGCSITAIADGLPVDTSMGFSPLEGLVMATRCGDLDPAVITYLQQQAGLDAEAIERMLNNQSGLSGLSGESSDMRVLLNSDNPVTRLTVDLYCYRVRKYIGAYLAVLGGADAIVFGGGVGENSAQVRMKILQDMEWMGVSLDIDRNKNAVGVETNVSTADSRIEVWVVPVDEANVMVREALEAVSNV